MAWRAPVLTVLLGASAHPEDGRAYVEALVGRLDGPGDWCAAALVMLALALLCTTLWATSSGIQPHRLTGQAILDHGMKLVIGRSPQFTLALWLSGLAYVFLLIQIIAGVVLSS